MLWMTVVFTFFLLFVFGVAQTVKTMWNVTWTDHLKQDLLLKYDKFARPSQQYNATVVTMDIAIRHILVDEKKSMVTVNSWTKFTWTDDKLKWNAEDYGGQSRIHVADHEIWQPDIVLYNSAQGNTIDHFGNTNCLLWNNGRALWVPPSQFFVFCNIDLQQWPYDRHTCTLMFGSWTYSVKEINLDIEPAGTFTTELEDMEWKVIKINKSKILKYYPCCPEAYPRLDFEITFQRKSSAYNALLITPVVVCIVLSLSVFNLSPTARGKSLLSAVTTVVITLLLIHFIQRLPVSVGKTPLIIEFYLYNLVLISISLVTSIIAVNVSHRPVPWACSCLLSTRVRSLLSLPNIKVVKNITENEHEELHDRSAFTLSQEEDRKSVQDWIVLAMAVDRILFVIYILMFMILSIILFIL